MRKEMKEIEEEIVINIKTDVPLAIEMTRELLKRVIKKEIEFDIRVREGSTDLQFILGLLSAYSISVLGNMTWDLIKFIWKKLKRESELGRDPDPAEIYIRRLSLEERITGYENFQELKRKFYKLK